MPRSATPHSVKTTTNTFTSENQDTAPRPPPQEQRAARQGLPQQGTSWDWQRVAERACKGPLLKPSLCLQHAVMLALPSPVICWQISRSSSPPCWAVPKASARFLDVPFAGTGSPIIAVLVMAVWQSHMKPYGILSRSYHMVYHRRCAHPSKVHFLIGARANGDIVVCRARWGCVLSLRRLVARFPAVFQTSSWLATFFVVFTVELVQGWIVASRHALPACAHSHGTP